MKITVESRYALARENPADYTHIVSISGPDDRALVPDWFASKPCLRLHFDDITRPLRNFVHPSQEHVIALLEFAARARRDPVASLLIHCEAGISRSPAAALIVCAATDGPTREHLSVARMVAACRGHAIRPNSLLVAEGDRALERDGRLVAALKSLAM